MEHLIQGEEELSKWVKKSKAIDSIDRLPGDASTRRYYRIRSGQENYIVMRTDPFADQGEKHLFLSVQRHLVAAMVDVPKVIDYDAALGFILLEDLGDITLLRRLQEVSEMSAEREIYKKCVEMLAHLHVKGSKPLTKPEIAAFGLHFDFEKLMWEMGFTIEHFYELHLGRTIKDSDKKLMMDGLGKICKELEKQPTVFCHRDYHSRNIMVTDDRYVMIDFQDARMGPAQYDLASLLRDSYYQLGEEQIEFLIGHYIDCVKKLGGPKIDRAKFDRVFDLMCVQRNFKAIGSFASFLNRRGNATYLKYIGNTFENIRRVLLKHPEFSQLREVLFHYYYF